MVDRPGSIAAASYTGDQIIRIVTPFLFRQLLFDLFADDGLQTCHHIRIRMRADCRSDNIVRVGRMTAPVADRLVGRIFQRHIAGSNGDDRRAQHLHLLHVCMLAFHIRLTHIDDTFHIHQRRDGSGRHAMLPGSRLGDDTGFPHPACQQDLPDRVVDLMSAGMVQVFTFQINLAAIHLTQPFGQVERRGTADIVPKQPVKFFLEAVAFQYFQILLL